MFRLLHLILKTLDIPFPAFSHLLCLIVACLILKLSEVNFLPKNPSRHFRNSPRRKTQERRSNTFFHQSHGATEQSRFGEKCDNLVDPTMLKKNLITPETRLTKISFSEDARNRSTRRSKKHVSVVVLRGVWHEISYPVEKAGLVEVLAAPNTHNVRDSLLRTGISRQFFSVFIGPICRIFVPSRHSKNVKKSFPNSNVKIQSAARGLWLNSVYRESANQIYGIPAQVKSLIEKPSINYRSLCPVVLSPTPRVIAIGIRWWRWCCDRSRRPEFNTSFQVQSLKANRFGDAVFTV